MEGGPYLRAILLASLDSVEHDVDAFSCGVAVCDDDLRQQAKSTRNRTLVMADGRRILGFSRYSYVRADANKAMLPFVRLDFVARDVAQGTGAGMEVMLRTFIRIAQDPRAADCKGVLIDSLNCGDAALCAARWRFFTQKVGFAPLRDDGKAYGYAFMAISAMRAMAEAAIKARS
jgi:hypothetical protein